MFPPVKPDRGPCQKRLLIFYLTSPPVPGREVFNIWGPHKIPSLGSHRHGLPIMYVHKWMFTSRYQHICLYATLPTYYIKSCNSHLQLWAPLLRKWDKWENNLFQGTISLSREYQKASCISLPIFLWEKRIQTENNRKNKRRIELMYFFFIPPTIFFAIFWQNLF